MGKSKLTFEHHHPKRTPLYPALAQMFDGEAMDDIRWSTLSFYGLRS